MIIFAQMLRAYKYRIYPNQEQQVLINKNIGCCRWIYNWGLNKKIELYKSEKKHVSKFDLTREIKNLRVVEETKWLSESNCQSLHISIENLDKAFVRFFKEKKGFPNFKSKHDSRQSCQYFDNVWVDFEKSVVRVPKMKPIKCVFSRLFDGDIKTTTITRTPTGKYLISILVDIDVKESALKKINPKTTIGIDTGIKTFLTLSNGTTFENNRYLKQSIGRLKILQRRASKKKKGSANRKKANLKVALLHEKITNQRHDYIHKITTKIVNENQVSAICIEDLNVAGMMQNGNLAQALNDVSIGKFYEILGYKCKWKGINLLKIGRWEASSKTCSNCGHIKKDLTLADRNWTCEKCKTEHDRDLNAAINIKDFALHPKNFTGAGSSEVSFEPLAVVKALKKKIKKTKV